MFQGLSFASALFLCSTISAALGKERCINQISTRPISTDQRATLFAAEPQDANVRLTRRDIPTLPLIDEKQQSKNL
jgi:hypothetical protein